MEEVLVLWKEIRERFCIHGIIYNTNFYNCLNCCLPEKVYYDDAYYYTIPCSFAEKIYLLNDLVTVYRIGDAEQSVSRKNRIMRVSQHEKVIKELVEEKKINSLSEAGKRYWMLKSRTTICDYYTTVFLRFDRRKEGVKKAGNMHQYIKKQSPELYRSLKKRFWIYWGMHLLHMNEKLLTVIVSSKLYKALADGK